MNGLMTVQCSDPDILHVVDDSYLVSKETIVVTELNDNVVSAIKEKKDINGLIIAHIPIETPTERYEKNLREIVRYYIYEAGESSSINKGNLFILSRNASFHAISVKVCQEEQRKITSNNFKIFPEIKLTCFDKSLVDLNMVIGIDDNTSLFTEDGTIEVNELHEEITDEDLKHMKPEDIFIQEPTQEGEVPQQFKIMMEEIFTSPTVKQFGKVVGRCSIGIALNKGSIIITRKMLKSKFLKPHTTEEEWEEENKEGDPIAIGNNY